MNSVPTSPRELFETGPLVHVTTIDPSGTCTSSWCGRAWTTRPSWPRSSTWSSASCATSAATRASSSPPTPAVRRQGCGRTQYPMRDGPEDVVRHVAIDRIYGQETRPRGLTVRRREPVGECARPRSLAGSGSGQFFDRYANGITAV